MNKHTPGPWTTNPIQVAVWTAKAKGKKRQFICSGNNPPDGYEIAREEHANARLIAAAPELYEIAVLLNNGMVDRKTLNKLARKALAKVHG